MMTIRFWFYIGNELSFDELTTNDPREFAEYQLMLMQEGARIVKLEKISEIRR